MSDDVQPSLIEIWSGDLFDRRKEAELLQAYIESVATNPIRRKQPRAFTIAVDAGYGEGKTFFLRRFAEHMSINHPVAFVDAWADDLADQPLTALAATLNDALKPFMATPEIQNRMASFLARSGQVAKIAGKGLLRRGLGLLITGGAVEGIDEVISGTSESLKESIEDGLKDLGNGLAEDTASAIANVAPHDLMQRQIAEFEEGRNAVQAMKSSLSAIIQALDKQVAHPPIIIVIDELDRCRPTYAIKLLEEIKHLFDVAGIVFVLGIHTEQLAHSVSGVYGTTFDGRAYLRRFIDRSYRLADPNLFALVRYLCDEVQIGERQIEFHKMHNARRGGSLIDFAGCITVYMKMYGLGARDSFQLIEILQTCIALSDGRRLVGAYLLPLAIGHILGKPRGHLPNPVMEVPYEYAVRRANGTPTSLSLQVVAEDYANACLLPNDKIFQDNNQGSKSLGVQYIQNNRAWNATELPLSDLARYPELIATVSRFGVISLNDEPTDREPQVRWLT